MLIDFEKYILPILVPVATFMLGIFGKMLITPMEKKKIELDIFKSHSDIISSHTETIAHLQTMIQSLINSQNDLEARIKELEAENHLLRTENDDLIRLIKKLTTKVDNDNIAIINNTENIDTKTEDSL